MTHLTARSSHPIGFILVPGFALMSYASATEPLRAANLLAGSEIYTTVNLSLDGEPVRSSSGAAIDCDKIGRRGQKFHSVFVCAGGSPSEWNHPALLSILRTLARQGVRIGGISGGPFLLAAAGLLDGRDFTIHWEHAPVLRETFPHLNPRHARFVLDGNRVTCGGGVAPLDMMHALIAERLGSEFARRVSDWYLHTAVAQPEAPQRASASERFGVHHPLLLTMLEKMEATIEQPLARGSMAAFVGISPRHVDRLFSEHLGERFLESYRRIRLQHAKRLLQQSPLSVSEIAFATGFSSAAHFSTAYRKLFGRSPRLER